jgi:hypothetical protein
MTDDLITVRLRYHHLIMLLTLLDNHSMDPDTSGSADVDNQEIRDALEGPLREWEERHPDA